MRHTSFVTGVWEGHYRYAWWLGPPREAMSSWIAFEEGRLAGEGRDPVGDFTLDGSYDERTGRLCFVKTYPGSHIVHYRGVGDEQGIRGSWRITWYWRGKFALRLTEREDRRTCTTCLVESAGGDRCQDCGTLLE